MVKKVDVNAVLEKIKEHAMNIIDKRVYLPMRNDSDSPYEIGNMRIANVRCHNLAKEEKYDVNSITLDDEFLVNGSLCYDEFGKKVFTDEENATKAMNGHPYLIGEKDLSPYVVTESLMDIKDEIKTIYLLAKIIKGQQMIFIVKDETSDKYQCTVMNIERVCVLTAATVPGGSCTDREGAIYIDGRDYIGSITQRYGEWCFYEMDKAMEVMYQKNREQEEKKRV